MKRLLLLGFAVFAWVQESAGVQITHRVTIQPIIVHSGTVNPHPTAALFEAETDKIWSQAGIDVRFLPVVTITNATYHNLSSNIQLPNSLHALAQMSGNGASPDPSVLNLWFVNSIDNNPGVIGFALQTSIPFGTIRAKNAMSISKYAFSFGGGLGMRDIVAHELGHNLGLYHGMNESGNVLATGELNLMSRTGSFPLHSDDITPHGAGLSRLNALEIARVLSVHPFVIALPPSERYEYTPVQTPEPPSDLAAVALSATEIQLSWTDSSDSEEGFRIYRSADQINFYEVASVGPDSVSFTDSGLIESTEYTYEIVSFNGAGESAPIEIVATTLSTLPLPLPPLAPLSFLVALTGPQTISMAWVDLNLYEDGFEVLRSTDGVNFTVIETLPAGSDFYSDSGLNPATIYYYRVRAFNAAGYSPVSNRSHTRTAALPPPATPISFLVALTAPQTISMSWVDASANESGFEVERSTDGVYYTAVETLPAGSQFYSDGGLSPGTIYYYRVRAFNAGGYSPVSNRSFTKTVALPPPATPLSFLVALTGPQTISMAWVDMATNEDGYEVERSTDGIYYTVIDVLPADSSFYSNSELSPMTIYYYRVRAFHSGGNSSVSNRSFTKTAAQPPPAAPTSLLVALTAPQTISMAWVDLATNEGGYEVARSTDGTNFTVIDTLPANSNSYADSGLNPVTIYYYRVRAFNAGGLSLYSNRSHTKTW